MIQWGNSSDISFIGWVNLTLKLGDHIDNWELQGPFLVTTDALNNSILCFNAIKELGSECSTQQLSKLFGYLFGKPISFGKFFI